MFKLDLEKSEEPEIKSNICWIIKKAREFQEKKKKICFIDYTKAFNCVDHNKLWKILRDGNTRPPYLPPRNLCLGQEATVRTGHGTMDWFQIGKGVYQGCILSSCLFNLYTEYIMWDAKLDEAQAGISWNIGILLEEISITSDTQVTPPLWQKAKRNWRASWWKWKKRVKKLA